MKEKTITIFKKQVLMKGKYFKMVPFDSYIQYKMRAYSGMDNEKSQRFLTTIKKVSFFYKTTCQRFSFLVFITKLCHLLIK